ncbi:MAG: hypothetical protein AB7L17_16440 [Ilumatobacteraceae bacterium]
MPVGGLSIAALVDATATSLGAADGRWSTIDLSAYSDVVTRPGFWEAYWFSLWIAITGTTIAAIGAALLGFAWARRADQRGRVTLSILQYNLGVPHLVWAVALVAVLSPSGWIARLTASAGLIDRPDQFPLLVNDRLGLGIIIHLVTKEVPFLLLASLPLIGPRLRTALAQAATLGAPPRAQLRHVYLPGVAPAFVPALVVVFAYALGAYEPAAVLGVQQPRTLAVVAVEWFRNPDLKFREQAFALSTILLATIAAAGAALLIPTRHWWAHGIQGRTRVTPART